MTHLSLFSGIGGLDLAAEWAGFRTVAFVERDQFCQKVLAKHWPDVPIHDDVCTFDAKRFQGTDLVAAGFPCQDVSSASADGDSPGIDGHRSGLWWQAVRVVAEVRPRWVVFENVAMLAHRGLDRVASTMEQEGYAVWPLLLGAGSAGAPHLRKRLFVVCHADRDGEPALRGDGEVARLPLAPREVWDRDAYPGSVRVADGVPSRMDGRRLKALGNAVVPQQAYPIFKAIAEAEAAR